MNLSEEENKDVADQVFKKTGLKVNPKDMNIDLSKIAEGITDLVINEQIAKDAPLDMFWIRAFLVKRRRLLPLVSPFKLRLKTYWQGKNGAMLQDDVDNKLSHYTDLDIGGFISRSICEIIETYANSHPEVFTSPIEASLCFTLKELDGKIISVCNLVKETQLNTPIEEVDLNSLF